MLVTAVSTGGAGAGLALVADNISREVNNVGTVCHQASGVVNAFVSNSACRGVDSIFWRVEMPTLLSNPRVTEIIINIFE